MQLHLGHTTEWDNFFKIVINEALTHLNCLSVTTKDQTILDVDGNQALLPIGYYKLLGLRTKNAAGVCSRKIYVDKAFLNSCGCNCSGFNSFSETFQINGGVIYFDTSEDIASIELAYMRFNVDEQGFIKIFEYYERALFNYACYQYMLSWSEKYKESSIERHSRTWVAQKSWIKGEDAVNDYKKNKLQISRLISATLINRDYLMSGGDFI